MAIVVYTMADQSHNCNCHTSQAMAQKQLSFMQKGVMRKILFALDDNRLSEAAFSFATKINEQEAVQLTGMYIPSLTDDAQWAVPGAEAAFYMSRLIEENDIDVLGNITAFKQACADNHISHRVHGLGTPVLQELRKETRFADILIVGLERYEREATQVFAEDDLQKIFEVAECPVVLVPHGASFPENIVVAYDGSADSVYALKTFAYLLPELAKMPAEVIYANAGNAAVPGEQHVKELVALHFSTPAFSVLEFDPAKYLATWMAERPGSMLVSGSYGRSELSQLFRKSFLKEVLREHKVPIFIAHR